LWDASPEHLGPDRAGYEALSVKADTEIKVLGFHPDGARLLIGGAVGAKVWDARPAPPQP